jgi:hypothetical protein
MRGQDFAVYIHKKQFLAAVCCIAIFLAYMARNGGHMTITEPETTRSVLKLFGQHMVALCVTYWTPGSPADEAPQFTSYPGVLLNIYGRICFLTAGHSLQELDEALHSPNVIFGASTLVDNFGLNTVCQKPIPFVLKSEDLFYINDDDDGLDFGIIALDSYYVRQLAANGIIPISEKNWRNQTEVKFDAFVMFGLPAEFASKHLNASDEAVIAPTLIPVRKVEADTKATTYPRFAGKVTLTPELNSLKGMSGGPIIGISIGIEVRYWIVALQSSWIPQSGLIFGCPIPVIASLMTEWGEAA